LNNAIDNKRILFCDSRSDRDNFRGNNMRRDDRRGDNNNMRGMRKDDRYEIRRGVDEREQREQREPREPRKERNPQDLPKFVENSGPVSFLFSSLEKCRSIYTLCFSLFLFFLEFTNIKCICLFR
jgi:hypothetical protein